MNQHGTYIIALSLAIIIGGFLALIFYINVIKPFLRDRAYIKMEMSRSFDEQEYSYWKNELKTLYIKHIPIIKWLK